MKRILVGLMAAMVIGVMAVSASLASPSPSHKVTICHATASVTNPYVSPTVDIASVKSFEHFKTEGHGTHVGPIFDPAGGKNQPVWGDIIPPFTFTFAHGPDKGQTVSYAGMNWTTAGQAIYNAGCQVQAPPPPPTNGTFSPAVSLSGGTCDTPDVTVLLDNTGSVNGTAEGQTDESATFDVTVNGQPVTDSPFTVAAGESQSVTVGNLKDGDKVVVTAENTDGEVTASVVASLDCTVTPPPPPPPGGGSGNPPPTTGGPTVKVVTHQAFTL